MKLHVFRVFKTLKHVKFYMILAFKCWTSLCRKTLDPLLMCHSRLSHLKYESQTSVPLYLIDRIFFKMTFIPFECPSDHSTRTAR